MNTIEVKKHIEEKYPLSAGTDDTAKYINVLMSIRRVAFLEGADYIMSVIKPIL